MKDSYFWWTVIIVDIIAVILGAMGFLGAYAVHLLILIHIYFVLAASLNLAVGYTGLLNLGHIALFGIGAYASTLVMKSGNAFLPALLTAIVITGICGCVLMYITRRLKQDYLALATFGFSYVVFSVLLNWTSLTRGPRGIPGIPRPEIFGWTLNTNNEYLVLTVVLTAICVGLLFLITRSPFGRLLEAVRDDEVSLQTMGKNTSALKLKALTISGVFAGIAGSLFAHYVGFIDPMSFMITELILIFTIIIVGGLASNKGNIIGVLLILLIPEILRFLPLPPTALGPLRLMLYALILLLILLYRPRGIFGKVDI